MKKPAILIGLACGLAAPLLASGGAKDPETVVVTYHVRQGKLPEMEKLMREDHWPLLQRLKILPAHFRLMMQSGFVSARSIRAASRRAIGSNRDAPHVAGQGPRCRRHGLTVVGTDRV